eukprot:Nitzschia sp. Nitz4//scaffold7_size249615//58531//59148//NITZ4_001154-RA/size249615-processed-gene-0.338-mRNA-1//-1//CDS//3329558373//4689//frame0
MPLHRVTSHRDMSQYLCPSEDASTQDDGQHSCSSFHVPKDTPKPETMPPAELHIPCVSGREEAPARKSVRFHEKVRCRWVTHYRQMTKAQRRCVWFNMKELDTIRQHVTDCVNLLDSGVLLGSELERQGVDHYRLRRRVQRQRRRVHTYGEVFEMQDLQDGREGYEEHCGMHEAMAHRYAESSIDAREEALIRARDTFTIEQLYY